MTSMVKTILIALALATIFSGCASPYVTILDKRDWVQTLPMPDYGDYPIFVVVKVRPLVDIRVECGPMTLGCFKSDNTLWIPRPVNFNDWPPICVGGHELWHRLGANHE